MEIERAVPFTEDQKPIEMKALSENLCKPEYNIHSLR
jgi:hypothetical protein